MRSLVVEDCFISPLTHSCIERSSAAPSSSTVVTHGPIGLNVSNDLARVNWPSVI